MFRWKPSKSQIADFKATMERVREFCKEHEIDHPYSCDSFYFVIDGQRYRVSNHSIEASNRHAYNRFGEQVRDKYHPDERDEDVIYIHASKTRIIDIYTDLLNGYRLDGRGNRKEEK